MENTDLLVVERQKPARLAAITLLAMGFRHRNLLVGTFVSVLLLAALAGLLLPNSYESEMKILVKKERIDPVISAGEKPGVILRDFITAEELNSELELIKSEDVLRRVVLSTGLHARAQRSLFARLRPGDSESLRVGRAVHQLGKDLDIEPLKRSSMIAVRYTAKDPAFAARVLDAVAKSYFEKHLQVRHNPRHLTFFDEEVERYRQKLSQAEAALAAFPRQGGTVAGQLDRDVAVETLGKMKMTLAQTQAEVAETRKRIAALQAQIPGTPARVTTQLRKSDNAELVKNAKTTLAALELKRVQLGQKYKPTYRLVQELDEEIAEARASVEAAEHSPVREEITDRDPTYDWMRGELAKARTEQRSLQGRAVALVDAIERYDQDARRLHASSVEQQELLRTVKILDEKYQMYVKKQEEARIAEALDRSNILNVQVAQQATVPVLPTRSTSEFLLVGILLAMALSASSVLVADHLDPSFRTPEEVRHHLTIPVLAALPKPAGSDIPA